MEIVPSNSENDDRLRRLNICKRKRTTFYKSKPSSSSSNNKVISLRNSRSSNTKAAGGGNFSEAPPRAMGIDGHFYECMKCNKVGSLICCDTCACTYHYECLDPPLESVPEGDWFCHNCSKEADGNLSDSTGNATSEASGSKRRRRSIKRACKVSSGCCLCSKIKKKIIPDENDFFSFRTKSKAQSNLSYRRGQPSAPNDGDDDDGGVGSAIIQRNTNNNNVDKRLVLRPRKRAEGNNYQIQTRKAAAKRASSSSAQAAEKEQNANDQPPRRRGRPRKYPQQNEQAPPPPRPKQQQQQKKKEKLGSAMVVYGANLPAEYLEAMRVAEEARRNNAKEIPWAGVELDALWVGVRRHGADNWDTILGDPNLCILVLCKKTSLDLSLRWKQELEKMSSILQASGYLISPPPPPAADRQQPEDDRPAISNFEATTAPQILPPQVTWTESGPSLPHRQGSSSSSASVPPPPPRTEGEAAAQQVLPEPPQFPDDGPAETGLVVPNNNQGSPSSCPMKSTEIGQGNSEEQVLTLQCGALVVPPNEHQATSSPAIPVEGSTGEQHVVVTSSESGGTLVGPQGYYQQGASSSRSISGASVTVAVPPPTWRQNLRLRPPPWRPNLNLNPMANNVMFEAFERRRANPAPPQRMTNHMAAPPAPRPPPNTTTAGPNLYLGGYFPVRNPY